MKQTKIILFLLVFMSCTSDDSVNDNTLESYISNRTIEQGAVIACAASDANTNEVLTFYYPEPGATNVRYYETENVEVSASDYSNYSQVVLTSAPFFNGYLGQFIRDLTTEKWIIVTFELNDEVKISNPIRTKQLSKSTVWTDAVTVNQSNTIMPIFTWEDNAEGDNAIYFQVVSNSENDLLSGTYTNDNQFQYYNTENVVLNITRETPPNLIIDDLYNFTLMDVSLDNWVNLVIQNSFITE